MKIRAGIVAGTALGLVMAAAPALSASPSRAPDTWSVGLVTGGMILLAQSDQAPTEEELRRRQQEQEAGEAPAEQPEAQEAPAEEPPADTAPVEEPQPQPEEAPPLEEPAPQQEAPVEEPTPEQVPVPPDEPQAPAEAAPAPEPAPSDAPAAEPAPEPESAPTATPEESTPQQAPVPEEQPEPPVDDAPAPAEEQTPEAGPIPEEQPGTPPQSEEERATPEQAPVPQEQPAEAPAPQPEAGTAPAPAPDAAPATQPAEPVPVENQQGTPVLDSQKEGNQQPPAAPAAGAAPAAQQAAPPPTTDREAQQLEAPVEIRSLRQEEGRRIERRDERRERREGTDVLREMGDRVILQFNNQTIVRSDDRDRLGRGASEVYYEELPRGRSRETIVRANGVQVVTIRDRYGDVIRRSRISPDGREYVLVYAGDGERERPREWRDPARDLPPLRLTIPVDEYILDARRADEPEDYYEFLHQPPVEPVRRLYSIDEVKYSARVRDSVRRIDLDTITFEFGSASISQSEIGRLNGVATAMQRLLEENPAETFLIEGHTDAVGSDEANLALSDRRAEAVAAALTNVFDIPPENLVTQGYGESYLKINTQDPERANRRVAMRRITPLVAPVADARP